MKRKVGELYGKPIIEGDKNLKTVNEIHIEELKNKEGGNQSSSDLRIVKMIFTTGEFYQTVYLVIPSNIKTWAGLNSDTLVLVQNRIEMSINYIEGEHVRFDWYTKDGDRYSGIINISPSSNIEDIDNGRLSM